MNKALILIDLINDLLIKRGYLEKIPEKFFHKINKTLQDARKNNFLIIHIRLGFDKDYSNLPKTSLLFGKADEFNILKSGSYGTEFSYDKINISQNDLIIQKTRVNPFYKTNLNEILEKNKITQIFVGGIATELAISSFVREAHDRDYNINIVSDLCSSLNIDDHQNELKILSKICNLIESNNLNF